MGIMLSTKHRNLPSPSWIFFTVEIATNERQHIVQSYEYQSLHKDKFKAWWNCFSPLIASTMEATACKILNVFPSQLNKATKHNKHPVSFLRVCGLPRPFRITHNRTTHNCLPQWSPAFSLMIIQGAWSGPADPPAGTWAMYPPRPAVLTPVTASLAGRRFLRPWISHCQGHQQTFRKQSWQTKIMTVIPLQTYRFKHGLF